MSCCDEPAPLLLLEGIAQFNRGEYFTQHETIEELWRAESRPVRRPYQGILQIGVALYHLKRRNYHGVVYMLSRGSMYLLRGSACLQFCSGHAHASLPRHAVRCIRSRL